MLKRDIDLNIQHSVLLGIECVHFFGRRIFCTQSAILRQWVSESDSPVQRSVGREGEEQEKLTFVILKEVE